ncbi:glutaminyl-peptide cyclotransferase [Saccharopolyspora rosea]|uniref:Glutaminyl-peptide cyclotransferase n=1 Tax=Saccharopolyspora rosea TaxID=524884 RepID=A0ABW3G0W2_9PSEU
MLDRRVTARCALLCLLLVAAFAASGCSPGRVRGQHEALLKAAAGPPRLRAQLIRVLAQDPSWSTTGLRMSGDVLFESTDQRGRDALRVRDPQNGRELNRFDYPTSELVDGIAVVGDRIWQLGSNEPVAIERDRNTLAETRRVPYHGGGGALCYDGSRLVVSDGDFRHLTFRDPQTFRQLGRVDIRTGDQLIGLDSADGQVWANVLNTDRILRIDPRNGQVTAEVDASGVGPPGDRSNGLSQITAVPGTDQFLLAPYTGSHLYQVRFAPA